MPNLQDYNSGYLERLKSLNLYTPTNMYTLEKSSLNSVVDTLVSGLQNNSFNFSNSILGRILLPNTPIQQIGNVELARNLARRISKNLRTNNLPTVTLNGFKISTNQPLSYWKISKEDDKTFSQLIQTMLGYQKDENPIPFIGENFTHEDSDNFLRKNRGQGQIDTYQNNVNKNFYNPEDSDKQYGKNDFDSTNIKIGNTDKSLFVINNNLINDSSVIDGYPSEVSKAGDNLNPDAEAFIHIDDNNEVKLLSKGDGTTSDDSGSKFLRVFTKNKPYATTMDLMKFNHGNAGINSVLQTVFPNTTPIREDIQAKNMMFSIENLAFENNTVEIKRSEKGVNGGRVMWFPPYDLRITENSANNWNKVEFIGRSEPIYTYNGSERTATISFTMIVDYPSDFWKKSWEGKSNNEFNKFFRQDNILTKNISIAEEDVIEVKKIEVQQPIKPKPNNVHNSSFGKDKALKYYFDNNQYVLTNPLKQDNTTGTGQKGIDDFNARIGNMITFLNTDEGKKFKIVISGFASKLDVSKYNNILSFFRGKTIYDLISSQLRDVSKNKLESYTFQLSALKTPKIDQYKNDKFEINFYGESAAINKDSTTKTLNKDVIDRRVMVYLEYNPKLDKDLLKPKETSNSKNDLIKLVNKVSDTKKIADETDFYFDRIKKGENKQLVYDNIEMEQRLINTYSENIKNFHPVFHSQTPEDFNSRLTFLSQCTKQGPSKSSYNNSIFGKPPVCVLRVGDFFHTKIIINSINKDYEPLIWDMNPEGIGMQPMLCRVTMDIVLLGGSSMSGVVNKLQNAIDFNFYANTEVYMEGVRKNTISQTTEQLVKAPDKPVKENSLLNRVKQTNSNTPNAVTGQLISQDGGQSGFISYNTQLDALLATINNWSTQLYLTYNDELYTSYIDLTRGLININLFNSTYTKLESDYNSKFSLISEKNTTFLKFRNEYNRLFNPLNNIVINQQDGNKILTDDSEFEKLEIVMEDFDTFYKTVILKIDKISQSEFSSEITKLKKYISTIGKIAFTV